MTPTTDDDSKRDELARRGLLHPRPDRVKDNVFDLDPFFDRRDLVQVKYEMLRSVRMEGRRVSQAARDFGLSRPTYYEALAGFERSGLTGLLPAKKGPRRAHKVSDEVLSFVDERLAADPKVTMTALASMVKKKLGVRVHPRSISRAVKNRRKKKR